MRGANFPTRDRGLCTWTARLAAGELRQEIGKQYWLRAQMQRVWCTHPQGRFGWASGCRVSVAVPVPAPVDQAGEMQLTNVANIPRPTANG